MWDLLYWLASKVTRLEPNWALLAVYQAKIKELEAAWRWTLPQLIEAIHDIWDHELTVDYFNKWIDSMPERIQQVIDRKGGPTKW